ncbi:MAG: S8 family serine peptidase, partial [Propionibacteriales bacterium]|nr:S8 family serine peptidase [Propionibacteriales bacterium]
MATLLTDQQAAGHARAVRPFWVFTGFAATVDAQALEALTDHPDVASVTLDETYRLPEPAAEPGGPKLPGWSLERVKAPQVWGEYGIRGEGVVVGVMDSGADGGHPALAGSWRGATGDPTKSWFAPTGEDYPTPGDGFGHGTHVTGSIVGGAPGDVVGVAPDAQWIAAKIFRDGGSTTSSIIHAGFQWMLAPGGDPTAAPDVVNNSWGSADTYQTEFWGDVDAWVAAGIVPMFANGNDGPVAQSVGSPGSFPQSIAVGATDVNDVVAGFSSRGPVTWDGVTLTKPQISAPGHHIYSAWPRQLPEGPYFTISGTSMATPHATGVVALMLSGAPNLTVAEVRDLLESTARVEPHMGTVPDNDYGHGITDSYAAVTKASHSGVLTGTVTGPDGPVEATLRVVGNGWKTTSSATSGQYELAVTEGTQQIRVSAPGYVTQTVTVDAVAGEVRTQDVTLAVAARYPVAGTVTGADGTVDGARVSVEGPAGDPVFSAADGRFALDLAEGEYVLRVTANGHGLYREEIVVDGPETVDVDLQP